MHTKTPVATFHIYNETDFSEFLLENSAFSRNYFHPTEFQTDFLNVSKKLEFHRENQTEISDSFYKDNNFFWLFTTEGEAPHKDVNVVALVALPVDKNKKGELVYLDASDDADPEALVEASRIAASIGGNEALDIDASNVTAWKETLNATLRGKLNA